MYWHRLRFQPFARCLCGTMLSIITISVTGVLVADDVSPPMDGQAIYNWAHPNEVRVAPEEMTFTSRAFASAKNEALYVSAYSTNGTMFLFCMFHIESLVVNRWGIYVLSVDPEGNVYWATDRPRTGSVQFSEDSLSLSNAAVSFSKYGDGYRLSGLVGELAYDIRLDDCMPPWKPGTGTVDYSDDGSLYQTRILVTPWANVAGTISVRGKTHAISGHGSIEKTRFSNPLTRFAPLYHSMRLYDREYSLYLLDVTLCDAYDNRAVPALGIAVGDEWLFTSQDYSFTVGTWGSAPGLSLEYPRTIFISIGRLLTIFASMKRGPLFCIASPNCSWNSSAVEAEVAGTPMDSSIAPYPIGGLRMCTILRDFSCAAALRTRPSSISSAAEPPLL